VTTRLGAYAYAVLIAGVVAFQLCVMAGAPWGALTQGGATSGVLPPGGRLIALLSACLLAVLAQGVLGRAGIGPLRKMRRLSTVLSWMAVACSVLAIVANAATPSAGERMVWLPVSVALLLTALVVVLGSRRSAVPR
jgi:hypothetical protein